MKAILVDLQTHSDDRGGLVSVECGKDVPFDVKRVYYLVGTKEGVRRGFHAHRALRQLAIAVSGSCTFVLDNGCDRNEVVLNDPTKGLLIEGLIWREMFDFSPNCTLLVLADAVYDESDYIRDYHDFLKLVHQQEATK